MKRINSLSDLLMEELADLLNAENQLIEALPRMIESSQSTALKEVLGDQLKESKYQMDRLQDIFGNIGQNPPRVPCASMKKFIEESEEVINGIDRNQSHDDAFLEVLQRMKHHEIARYSIAREHAEELGHTRIVELLDQTLNEERSMNLHLNELAQSIINVQAIDPNAQQNSKPTESVDMKGKGFYIPGGRHRKAGIKKKTKGTDVSRFISEGNPNIQGQ